MKFVFKFRSNGLHSLDSTSIILDKFFNGVEWSCCEGAGNETNDKDKGLGHFILLKLYGCDYLLNLNELIYLFINVLIKYDFHKEIIALSITRISWEYSSNLILLLQILNYSYEKAKKKYHCGLSLDAAAFHL